MIYILFPFYHTIGVRKRTFPLIYCAWEYSLSGIFQVGMTYVLSSSKMVHLDVNCSLGILSEKLYLLKYVQELLVRQGVSACQKTFTEHDTRA